VDFWKKARDQFVYLYTANGAADSGLIQPDSLLLLQAYPKRDITNIVESSHYVRVNGWCKPGRTKCKLSRWVKPYRCLGERTLSPFAADIVNSDKPRTDLSDASLARTAKLPQSPRADSTSQIRQLGSCASNC